MLMCKINEMEISNEMDVANFGDLTPSAAFLLLAFSLLFFIVVEFDLCKLCLCQ